MRKRPYRSQKIKSVNVGVFARPPESPLDPHP
jgi:hypothetical protein